MHGTMNVKLGQLFVWYRVLIQRLRFC